MKKLTVTSSQAGPILWDLLDLCEQGHEITITRRGKPAVVLLPVNTYARLQAADPSRARTRDPL